jgi:uncharacterized protein YvpB
MRKILKVKHNDQIDNSKLGRITPGGQCGYTSACMVLSAFIPEAENDKFVESFILMMDLDFVNNKSNTRQGAVLTNYPKQLDKLLMDYLVPRKTKILPHSGTNDDIIKAINIGCPVMAATKITNDGHFICIIGYDDERKCWIVNDPYGQYSFADSKYIKIGKHSGSGVEYPYTLLAQAMIKSSNVATGKNGYRLLWIE